MSAGLEGATIEGGRIVGRFIYTSRGVDGWAIATQAGEVVPEVAREAQAYIERITGPAVRVGQVPPLAERPRRMVWAGNDDGQWRFVINTVLAGNDSSMRPNNNVTDCLLVRRGAEVLGPATDPAQLWGSPGWLTPYGADEVAKLDFGAAEFDPLAVQVPDGPTPLVALAELATMERDPSLIYNVASLVHAIDTATRGAGWTPRTVIVDDVSFAPIFLGAALSVVPREVGWRLTFEIRKGLEPVAEPTVRLVLVERAREGSRHDSGDVLELAAGQEQPRVVAPDICRTCGQPRETWASVVTACLVGVGLMITAEPDSGKATAAIAELVQLMSELAGAGVPAEEVAGHFRPGSLEPGRQQALAAVVGPVGGWQALDMEHGHVVVIPADPGPSQPSTGERLLADPAARQVAAWQLLRSQDPGEASWRIAEWLLDRRGERAGKGADPIIECHALLGDPRATSLDLIDRFVEFHSRFAPEFQATLDSDEFGYPFGAYQIFLGAVLKSAAEGRVVDGLAEIAPAEVASFATRISRPTWHLPLLSPQGALPLLQVWWGKRARAGSIAAMLRAPVSAQRSLAEVLAVAAIRNATSAVDLTFLYRGIEFVSKERPEDGVGASRARLLAGIEQRWYEIDKIPRPRGAVGGSDA